MPKKRLESENIWWALRGSNSRHSACKADALPAELSAPKYYSSDCNPKSEFAVISREFIPIADDQKNGKPYF